MVGMRRDGRMLLLAWEDAPDSKLSTDLSRDALTELRAELSNVRPRLLRLVHSRRALAGVVVSGS